MEFPARPNRIIDAFLTATLPLLVLALLQLGLPALSPALMATAGRPAADFGLFSGAMGLGAVWLYLVNGAFTGALGPRRACRVAALVSATGVGLLLTGHFLVMLVGAILIGFGYAVVTPAGAEILARHTPAEHRATLFSTRQAAVPLAGMLAGAVGARGAELLGLNPTLTIAAVLCVVLAAGLGLSSPELDGTRSRPRFSVQALFSLRSAAGPFRLVATVPGLGRIALCCIGFATMQSTVNTFLVVSLTTTGGLSLAEAGAMFATMQAVSMLGRLGIGWIADRFAAPRRVLACLATLSAVSGLLLALQTSGWSDWQRLGVMILAGLSVATWNGLYLAEAASLAPDDVAAATTAASLFVFATYTVVPPMMTLLIAAFGLQSAFVAASLVVATAPFVLLRSQ